MRRLIITCLIMLILPNFLFAKDLTELDLQQWISTFKDIKTWSKGRDFQSQPEDKSKGERPRLDSPFTDILAKAKEHKDYKEFEGLLKRHGYSGGEEWAGVGDKIMAAFMAIQMGEHQNDMQRHMAQAQAQMGNMQLTDAQKAMLQSAMSMSEEAIEASSKASDKDIAVVKKHLEDIKQAVDAE